MIERMALVGASLGAWIGARCESKGTIARRFALFALNKGVLLMIRLLLQVARISICACLLGCFFVACTGGGPTECQDDTSCDSGFVCKAGTDGKKTCQQDTTTPTDCSPPCAAGEKCVSRKCVQCETNADCKEKEACVDGKCEATPGPNTCTKDEDCTPGKVCKSGSCEDPPAPEDCTVNTQCPTGSACNTVTKKCEPVPSGCTTDVDCKTGETCNTTTKKCEPSTPSGAQAGEECNQQVQCAAGLICISAGGGWEKSYCFVDCKGGASCPNGNTCVKASDTISICAKQAKAGEDCSISGTNQTLCAIDESNPEYCSFSTKKCTKFKLAKEGESCDNSGGTEPFVVCEPNANLACQEGKCIKLTDANKYDPCGLALKAQCKSGSNLTCVNTSQESGHCFTSCDTGSPTCDATESCEALQDGSTQGVCLPKGSLDYGALCGVEPADKYDPTKLCGGDLSCVNFGQRVCVELSSGNCQSYTCKTANTTCVDLSAGTNTFAGCFTKCTTDADCKGETFCRDQGASGKVCWPKEPPGDVVYGEVCKRTTQDRKERCQAPNVCLGTDVENGFCTTECTADADCQAYTGGGANIKASCVTIDAQSGAKRCLFSCTVGGSDPCPTGLTCRDIGGIQLCAPKPPVGPNDNNQKCNNQQPISQAGCKEGFRCVATNQNGDGLCTADCSLDTECKPAGTINTSCVKGLLQDQNAGLCVVPCGQPGQTCPTGLQCNTFGQVSICSP